MKPGGMLICFTGIDGSGKTTQAKLLVDWLLANGRKSSYLWSRGEVRLVRRFLLFIGRKVLGTTSREIKMDEKSYHEYQSRKARLMQYSLVRIIWSAMTQIEHIIQINVDVRQKIHDGDLIVCDRYLWDSTVDMAVLNNKKPEWLLNCTNSLILKLVPEPTITFFIDIPPEEAMKRKDDIPSFDYVRNRADLYRFLASRYSMEVINGCEELTFIQSKIQCSVNNLMQAKGRLCQD